MYCLDVRSSTAVDFANTAWYIAFVRSLTTMISTSISCLSLWHQQNYKIKQWERKETSLWITNVQNSMSMSASSRLHMCTSVHLMSLAFIETPKDFLLDFRNVSPDILLSVHQVLCKYYAEIQMTRCMCQFEW